MYAAYAGGTLRVPFADDIQGACALYPGTPGGLGWACNQNSTCTSNICVNPGASGYCTQTCGTCPVGYACGPNPQNAGQQVCLRDDGLNKQLCEVCQTGLPGACANNGICITGLPSPQEGRCVTPAAGGCPMNYQSLQVQFPRRQHRQLLLPAQQRLQRSGQLHRTPAGPAVRTKQRLRQRPDLRRHLLARL
jgi:hypothetical protein